MNGSEWCFKLRKNDSGYLGSLEIRYIGSEIIPENIAFLNVTTGGKPVVIGLKTLPVTNNVYVYQLLRTDIARMQAVFDQDSTVKFTLFNGKGTIGHFYSAIGQPSHDHHVMDQEQKKQIRETLKDLLGN